MLKAVRKYPLMSILPMKQVSDVERLASIYVGLNVELAALMKLVKENNKEEILTQYCHAMRYFLEIGNAKKWTYLLLLEDEELEQMQAKWQSSSYNKVYLIMQQQLNKCYFENKKEYLVHAWHIFVKFGINELKLTPAEIEEKFFEIY